MQPTKQLYYDNRYQKEGTATLLDILPQPKGQALVLDATIFYPQGGGQPGDKGMIDSVFIYDTHIDDQGRILHLTDDTFELTVGQQVHLKLDWEHRYDYMQQHTAQHLLSGRFFSQLGINTVAVHFGKEEFSIEIDLPELAPEHIYQMEEELRSIINSSTEVESTEVSHQKAVEMGLRREIKVDGPVRLIRIGSFDTIACGGVHVANTRELIYVQYVGSEKIRGRLKTFWSAGNRSVHLIRRNQHIIETAGTLLSSPPQEITEHIASLQTQAANTRYQLNRSFTLIAKLLLGNNLKENMALFDASSWQEEHYQSLGEALLDIDEIALCTVRQSAENKVLWLVALKGRPKANELFARIRQEALPLINGKGGGKEPLWQGVGTSEGKDSFLAAVRNLFEEWRN
ncbi:MAG: alanyl-tRNA editing protein [Sphaerochaetaceae bacterium]